MKRLAYFSFALLTACATTGDDFADGEQDSSGTTYVQIQDFNGAAGGAEESWYDINSKLATGFNNICGDTFCEGDWSNITALRVYCSVSSKIATIHDCAWAFTASTHEVDTKTAAVVPNAVTFQCHFKPKTSGPKLIALLEGSDDPLDLPLPGMGSIYDAIGDCFEHPIGATTIDVSPFTKTYVDAENYYSTFPNQQKWRDSVAALHQGFDQVCGDTFCGSDYSDVQALDLGCSVTKSTGNMKNCVWNFGGSYSTVKTNGDLDLVSKTWSCPVTVHGTIGQMISVLTSTTDPETNAIQRTLPGGVSAYDSIAGCVTR